MKGELSEEERLIKRDYEIIGRAKYIKELTYEVFRKELYPQLIILYGPSKVLIDALVKNYLLYIGYKLISVAVKANELVSKYSKN